MSWNIGGLRIVISMNKPSSCEVKAKARSSYMMVVSLSAAIRWSEDERYAQLNGRVTSECGIY